MDYGQYKTMRQDILDECNKQLDALDMVWKRLQALNAPTKNATSIESSRAHGSVPFSKMLRTVIKGLTQDFNADDVQLGLIDHGFKTSENINRLAITNSLHRLLRRGEIDLVKRGQGKQGSIYRQKQEESDDEHHTKLT